MPKIGNFELPELDQVESACDVCHVLNRVGQDITTPTSETGSVTVRRKERCTADTKEFGRFGTKEGKIGSCTDSTRARILLEYFKLIKE